jgi:hypothetical protein
MPADPCRLCDQPHDGPRYIAGLGEHDWAPGWEPPRKPLPKSDRAVTYPTDPHDPDGTRMYCGDRLPFGRN